jgi:hypothetical protein
MSYDGENFNYRLRTYVADETEALVRDGHQMNPAAAHEFYEEAFQRPHEEKPIEVIRTMVIVAIHDEMVRLMGKFKKNDVADRGSDDELFEFGGENGALGELVDRQRERLEMQSEHRRAGH